MDDCYIFILESPPVKKRKVTFCQTPAIITDNKSSDVKSSGGGSDEPIDVETVKDDDNTALGDGNALTLPTDLVGLITDNVSDGQIRLRKATDCVAEGIDTSPSSFWKKRNTRKRRGKLMIVDLVSRPFSITIIIMCLLVISYSSIQSIPLPIHPYNYLFVHTFTYSSIPLPIHPYVYLFVHTFIYSSIHLNIRP